MQNKPTPQPTSILEQILAVLIILDSLLFAIVGLIIQRDIETVWNKYRAFVRDLFNLR